MYQCPPEVSIVPSLPVFDSGCLPSLGRAADGQRQARLAVIATDVAPALHCILHCISDADDLCLVMFFLIFPSAPLQLHALRLVSSSFITSHTQIYRFAGVQPSFSNDLLALRPPRITQITQITPQRRRPAGTAGYLSPLCPVLRMARFAPRPLCDRLTGPPDGP